MKQHGYRTLMLEPQWHPMRRIRQWIKDEPFCFFMLCFFWDLIVPFVVSLPYPEVMALWPWWRWTLFGLSVAPLIALIIDGCIYGIITTSVGIWNGFWWFHRHPPFKVKTRYLPATKGEIDNGQS